MITWSYKQVPVGAVMRPQWSGEGGEGDVEEVVVVKEEVVGGKDPQEACGGLFSNYDSKN